MRSSFFSEYILDLVVCIKLGNVFFFNGITVNGGKSLLLAADFRPNLYLHRFDVISLVSQPREAEANNILGLGAKNNVTINH